MIKKVLGGAAVIHCHGKEKGKPIKVYRGKGAMKKAQKLHYAIEKNK